MPEEVPLRVEACQPGDPHLAEVLAGLAAEYGERYGTAGDLARISTSELLPPRGAFVVVVDSSGRVLAGGGLRLLDDRACEVKRMWTRPDARRRGLASSVLDELEGRARSLGCDEIVLETGPAQPEAIALYAARYERVPAYGPHDDAVAFRGTLVERSTG